MTCLVLAAYWWHKFKEMFLRGIYFVTGFLLGAITMFTIIVILWLLGDVDISINW